METQIAPTTKTTATRPVVEQTRTGGCLSYLLFDPETKDAAVIDPRADGVDARARETEGGRTPAPRRDRHARARRPRLGRREARARDRRRGDRLERGRVSRAEGSATATRSARSGSSSECIATPGHTSDSLSFQVGDVVFTGDALLIGGAGRTDFQNGSPDSLFDTLREQAPEARRRRPSSIRATTTRAAPTRRSATSCARTRSSRSRAESRSSRGCRAATSRRPRTWASCSPRTGPGSSAKAPRSTPAALASAHPSRGRLSA